MHLRQKLIVNSPHTSGHKAEAFRERDPSGKPLRNGFSTHRRSRNREGAVGPFL